jgi:hypothetical protein
MAPARAVDAVSWLDSPPSGEPRRRATWRGFSPRAEARPHRQAQPLACRPHRKVRPRAPTADRGNHPVAQNPEVDRPYYVARCKFDALEAAGRSSCGSDA